MKSQKISLKEIKQLPPHALLRMINKAKKYLKKDQVWQDLCKENKVEVDIIDLIPTKFGNLDVNAKTDHGIIILNYKLLCDGNLHDDYSYLIHEYTHWFQQCLGDEPTQSADDGDYLSNKFEQEGFSNQVEYIANHEGKEEAEEYVDNLLDYHEVTDDKKDELQAVFLEKV